MLLRADWVLSLSSPPIENGSISVPCDGPDINLGNSILLPGFVNAHCHLEFWRDHISPQPPLTLRGGFTQWVRDLPNAKSGDLKSRIQRLMETGTTVVADHCSPETDFFDTSFRRVIFWEVLGVQRERARASLYKALSQASRHDGHVSPHSLYAVHEEVLEEILSSGSALQSIHLLESADEDRFFREQSGPLANYVQERGGESSFLASSPVRWLMASHRLGPGTLLIHANYLNTEEIDLLRRSGAGVIHCPGSHRFFGHRRFPYEALRENGVPMALGTDSLASNEDLSMLREMRLFHETYPEVPSEEILRMATLGGARMLGLGSERADYIAVPLVDASQDPYENVLLAEKVLFSMIDGEIHIPS